MARRLRFFKEQMAKAGISASPAQLIGTRWDFDELEVMRTCTAPLSCTAYKSLVPLLTLPIDR
jgi:hypothetical protein